MNDNIKLYNSLENETPSSTTDLPPPDTKRWVTRRKAVIVNAVRTGVISLEEVCRRYELSVEEFLAWERAIDTHGVPGLRVTRLQIYRDNPPSRVESLVAKRNQPGVATGPDQPAVRPPRHADHYFLDFCRASDRGPSRLWRRGAGQSPRDVAN